MYDGLTHPVVFPRVSACVASSRRCVCYSQQGTRLPGVSAAMCKDFVRDGAFNPYLQPVARFENGGVLRPHAEPTASPRSSAGPVVANGATLSPVPAERPLLGLPGNGGQAPAGRRPRPLDLIEGHK